ncbi:uncharacterized protein LOC131211916 [Anopheles bellator]|uniref:uncharacterized protein LOC131211916 n=1 Tax=Anopheles bellator TaxID=139047 RepID=UPI0026482F35|nr:uncharacterized protein LOC131211916 [Anopheles bellator]
MSLCLVASALACCASAYRFYPLNPMMARRVGGMRGIPMRRPVPIRGFVRAPNPNADGAMDGDGGDSGQADPDTDTPEPDAIARAAGGGAMREMIHSSGHPVEIDMGTDMQARMMGFMEDAEADGNFGRAAGDEGDEQEEGGAQFRHKKHKKHKHVVHTHHHYHHQKHGGGYGHGHQYGHGHGHRYDDGDEDYEPTYGHHGRYRRAAPAPDQVRRRDVTLRAGFQALDTDTAAAAPPPPLASGEADGPELRRQSVSRRQLVGIKNERLAASGRERSLRAYRLRSLAKRMIDGLADAGSSMRGPSGGAAAGWTMGGSSGSSSADEGATANFLHWRPPRQQRRRGNVFFKRRQQAPICSNFYVDERTLTSTERSVGTAEDEWVADTQEDVAGDTESFEDPLEALMAQRVATDAVTTTRSPLWRGIKKRLNSIRERHAKSLKRTTTTTSSPRPAVSAEYDDDDRARQEDYGSNEIVEFYNRDDVGRVLYRMANGRLIEEPQRFHLRRSPADEVSPWRQRRIDRLLAGRPGRKRVGGGGGQKATSAPDEETVPPSDPASVDKQVPVINIGTFRLSDNKVVPKGPSETHEGIVQHSGPSGREEMDNYIRERVREYCKASPCGAAAAAPGTHPEKKSEVVGSALIVQPPGTYEESHAAAAPATTVAAPPKVAAPPAASCPPSKIVKCIPKAYAKQGRHARTHDDEDDHDADPLVSFAFRRRRRPLFGSFLHRMFHPFGFLR